MSVNTFLLVLSTPEGNVFEKEVYSLSLRGEGGDLAVMAGHIPFVTTVRAGKYKITLPDGEEINGISSEGLLSVGEDKTVFLAGEME